MDYLTAVDGCFLDTPAGAPRVAWDVALAMRDRGHHVTMVCFAPDGRGGLSEAHGIRILRCARVITKEWNLLRSVVNVRAVRNAIRKTFPGQSWDVVHLHLPPIAAGTRMALGDGPRYVYTLHSPAEIEQRINWSAEGILGKVKLVVGLRRVHRIEHRLLAACSAIHTLSQFTASLVERLHGMGAKVTVIPHWRRPELRRTCSKREARKALRWPEDEFIFFTVRRHTSRMGLEIALDALAPLVIGGKCRLFLGGDGPLRPALEQHARKLGAAPDRVRFLGRLSEKDLHLAYQAADVFLLPTVALEGFGLITIEAMSFGCPVIGTDAGATPEILNPISPHLMVPAGDASSLRKIAEAVLSGSVTLPNEDTLVHYINSRYSYEHVFPRLESLITGD
jgi:glycosyltransferase involved in cell wall biosynthesis